MRLLLLIVSSFLLSAGFAQAQDVEIFGAARDECVTGGGGAGNSSLYRVDPDTAQAQLIGDIGFKGVTAFAFLPDGRLVASAREDGGDNKSAILIEIDPATGAGSLIGTIGERVEGECGRAPGLSVDPMTGTLFATGDSCEPDPADFLQTVNPGTGEGTLIGTYDPFNGGGNGLAVSNGGVFFVSVCCSGDDGFAELITVNPNSGAPTFIADLTLAESIFVNALAFHPLTGELFGSTINETDSPAERSSTLVKINTETGATTTVGDLPDCFDGIVFRGQRTVVPTLSEWGLIAMAGILGIVGFMVMRRRKVTA